VLHLAAVGDERLLEVVGHRGPKVFLVFGDDFFAARAAGEWDAGRNVRVSS